MLEALVHSKASFVSLSYKDECLPDGGSLEPRALQLFMKRLRFHMPAKVRFYGVGEYGDESWRPHYHLALFGVDMADMLETRPPNGFYLRRIDGTYIIDSSLWEYGRTHVGLLTQDSAQYIAGYVSKKMTGKDDERLLGRYPEFARMSLRPGIGANAIGEIANALSSDAGSREVMDKGDVPGVLRHGRSVLPLGRYMRAKLREAIGFRFIKENPDEVFKETAELLALYNRAVTDGSVSLGEFVRARREQQMLNVERRSSIYRKGGVL